MMGACFFALPAHAEDCALLESRAALAPLSGVRIASVDIEREGPDLPSRLDALGVLHPVSTELSIRRQLLFAAGDSVDTLLVGETMRRLRRDRLFSDVVLLARRCDPSGAVALVLRTRDSWTLRPTARLRTPSTISVGVEERNLFGTGRSVSFTSETAPRGTGLAGALSDPFFLGRDISANVRMANLAGNHSFRAGLRNHEFSVFDTWRAEAAVARFSFGDTTAVDRPLNTFNAAALVGRRIGAGGNAITLLLLGAEFDSTTSVSETRRIPSVLQPHARSFIGGDVGVMRRTAEFDTASWIVPHRGFLDVPLGWEGEMVAAPGYERGLRVPAMKMDAWLGRVWIPRRGSVLMLDGWASGYVGHGLDANHIARLSSAWYSDAAGGMWGARVTVERLFELDPDLRGLSLMPLADYTAPAVRNYSNRGGRAIAASIERSLRLLEVGAASVLDAGAFVAGSSRRDVNGLPDNRLDAGVIGARFRVLSANGSVNSIRFDIGYPFVLSDAVPKRGFAVLTFGSLFDVSRQRDGRRLF